MLSSSPKKTGVKFGRRTSSGRILSLPRDDKEPVPEITSTSSGGLNDFKMYNILMPPTPDNQSYTAVSSSSTKPDDLPPLPRANETRPMNQLGSGAKDDGGGGGGDGGGVPIKLERRIYAGDAFRSQDDSYDDDGSGMNILDLMDKPWKPLTTKVRVPAGILSPYRLLIQARLVCLIDFLIWRISNANTDALWLWGLSTACEIWFAFSWLLDILPKINPINRAADLAALHEKFDTSSPSNPMGESDLPGIDVFISTADPEKEPPLVTANTILSVLATEYPVEKLTIYVSDDGGALLTFEAMAEAASFAEVWVPFCRKHCIEPRNPDTYFNLKIDPTKNKKQPDFVKDRRWIKCEYDEFKVRINGLPEAIRKRSKTLNSKEQRQAANEAKEKGEDPVEAKFKVPTATWMVDSTHWPGTWKSPSADHSSKYHAGILQIMIKAPDHSPVIGKPGT